jgi:hypothetical protein
MNPKVTALLRNKWTIPVLGSAVSFGVGIAVGYFFAKKHLEETVEVVIEDTVQLTFKFEEDEEEHKPWTNEQMREYVESQGHKYVIAEEDYLTDQEIALREQEGGEESLINVFTETDEEWDYELEAFNRDPTKPYVIHRDEFFGDEMGWDSQSTLTYYAGDQVLTDERDGPLMNPDRIVGDLKFGHGSGDPNVCYVRNERLQAEYEVLQDPGSYEDEILGLHVETQMEKEDFRHSRSPGKFREE